jgi:TrpR family trp operon transcriptional repressor
VNEALAHLAEATVLVTDPRELEKFLSELLTPAELHDLVLRWKLLELLEKGVSQRKVAEALGISLCKITRGAKILKRPDSIAARVLAQKKRLAQKECDAGNHVTVEPARQACG